MELPICTLRHEFNDNSIEHSCLPARVHLQGCKKDEENTEKKNNPIVSFQKGNGIRVASAKRNCRRVPSAGTLAERKYNFNSYLIKEEQN